MPSKPTVYLAGPIRGLTVEEASDWRDTMTYQLERVGIRALSPMRYKAFLLHEGPILNEYPDHPMGTAKGITTRDRFDVMRCDAVFANLLGDRPSVGTMIELGWADAYRKPIVAMWRDADPADHPMVRELVGYRVASFAEACEVLAALLV